MHQLKHNKSIRYYVKKFSMLVLQLPRMDENDKLHYFTWMRVYNHESKTSCIGRKCKTYGLQQPLQINRLINCPRSQPEASGEMHQSGHNRNGKGRGGLANVKGDGHGYGQVSTTPQLEGLKWTGYHVYISSHQSTDCLDQAIVAWLVCALTQS